MSEVILRAVSLLKKIINECWEPIEDDGNKENQHLNNQTNAAGEI